MQAKVKFVQYRYSDRGAPLYSGTPAPSSGLVIANFFVYYDFYNRLLFILIYFIDINLFLIHFLQVFRIILHTSSPITTNIKIVEKHPATVLDAYFVNLFVSIVDI